LVGNRLAKATTRNQDGVAETITYSQNANDQLTMKTSTTKGVTSYGYSANGELVSKVNAQTGETVSYGYNLENRLIAADIARVEKDSQGQPHNVAISSAYQYNQSGIRTKANSTTTIAGQAPYDTTRIFLNDGMNMTGYSQVLEELPVLGVTPTVSYVMGDDVLGQTNTAGTRWLGCDGHGSTRLLSDSSGGITDRFSFDAYGCQLGPKANVVNPATTSLLYSGETQDFDLDMQYLRARYYDQSVGAFASLDPAQGNNYDPRSLHKYAYAGLDPVNGADPSGEDFSLTGLLCSTAIGAIIGAIAGGVYAKYSGNNVWKGILIGAGVGALFGATVYLLWSGVAALKSGALQRFFWDNRAFDIIRRQYWQQYGPASGRSLHHWLVPQRWTWLPQGIRNAGFNLLEMPKILSGPLGLNQWMGFALRWGGSRYVVAMMIEGEIKVLLPITALATYHAGKWAGNELAAEVLNLDDGATATPLKLSSEEEEELQEDTGRAFLEEL
jgi:RHS repeat-associated protein